MHALSKTLTYQDACHLAHGQHIREQPRALLRQIPGCEFVEMPHADRCCGAAGVYSLTHAQTSSRVLAEKLDALEASGAQVVATANPGCAMALQAGVADRGLDVAVRHVVELLDAAYAESP
jgi:glycolate oxidase iron-sulfur subunit